MSKSMLIDAAHSEETRVVVVGQNGLEEFDFESASLRTLKGNIYLAKVTRVEPSLQAAFVTYGGNRHGFLPFNEIHPDYYRIPIADREALAAADAADRAQRIDDEEDDDDDDDSDDFETAADDDDAAEASDNDAAEASDDDAAEASDNGAAEASDDDAAKASGDDAAKASNDDAAEASDDDAAEASDDDAAKASDDDGATASADEAGSGDDADASDEEGEDAESAEAERPRRRQRRRSAPRKHYKIQEVIKRGQIMLVQVAKEERGGKGAALTTYISLAGRYCVLMPNTGKGGGISRKITDAKDRKRLKSMIADLDLPDGMAVIVRTAGVQRTKAEIKRDHEFLLRLWEEIRETTMASTAPALIYEEASLVKRAIRDLYGRDIEEVLVEGDGAYREAKDFMRSLMPSHAKRVQPYKETTPLFQARGVEGRLESLFEPIVRLPSGGYLVINQTEALVAIDVNSGRATRERNIEETATKTNLEAAVEAARQLRLRELAGIVVIDFIDMDDRRNNAAVERKLKDALKQDRARVHVGRMSQLGLIEMSRQRLRPSMFETSFHECVLCGGLGRVRSVESNALGLLRVAEEKAMQTGKGTDILITAASDAIVYLLNHKREGVARIEESYGVRLLFNRDDAMPAHERRVETVGDNGGGQAAQPAIEPARQEASESRGRGRGGESEERGDNRRRGRGGSGGGSNSGSSSSGDGEERESGRRRGRRGGRGRNEETDDQQKDDRQKTEVAAVVEAKDDSDDENNRRRRRGRRGGRRRGRDENASEGQDSPDAQVAEVANTDPNVAKTEASDENSGDGEEASRPRRRRRRRGRRGGSEAGSENGANAEATQDGSEATVEAPSNADAPSASVEAPDSEASAPIETEAPAEASVEPEPTPAEAPGSDPEPLVESVEAQPEPELKLAADPPALEPEPEAAAPEPEPEAAAPEPEPEPEPEPTGPARRGWWSRNTS